MNWKNPQSGVYATDFYRESKGQQARQALLAGKAVNTKNTDHLNANELCIEVIARRANDHATCASDAAIVNTANLAVNNLSLGIGYHKKQSDHSGGNTCAAVIAAATG